MNKIDMIYKLQKEYGFIKSINLSREINGEECGQYNLKLLLVNFPCWDTKDHLDIVMYQQLAI